jgi:hypothetical protein
MTSSDPTEPDVETMRAVHRAASEQIDARPDPRVRAAVLAQATATIAARQRRATSNPFRVGRWPLSMAAVLVVSVMTGVVVTRTMHDEPDRVVPDVAMAPPVVPPAKHDSPLKAEETQRPSPPIAQPAAQPTPTQAKAARPREASRAKAASPLSTGATTNTASADAAPPPVEREPSRAVLDRITPWPGSASPATTAPGSIAPAAPAPAPPAPAPVPASPRSASPFAPEQNVVPSPAPAAPPAPAASPRATSRDALSQSGSDRAKAFASASRRSVEEKTNSEPATPEAWVERIVRLRDAGQAEEADRELEALRRRYPGFAIPQAALASTGTR